MENKSQISIEYLIIFGFVFFIVIGVLGFAFIFSGEIKDKIVMNHVNNFASNIVSNTETVFYDGYPSKTTIRIYIPSGIRVLDIRQDGNDEVLYLEVELNSGTSQLVFPFNVPIDYTDSSLAFTEGTKKIVILAQTDNTVLITGE